MTAEMLAALPKGAVVRWSETSAIDGSQHFWVALKGGPRTWHQVTTWGRSRKRITVEELTKIPNLSVIALA